jgi:hypothetical protein
VRAPDPGQDPQDRSGHQASTCDNLWTLRNYAHVPIIPVLQGWTADDYVRHIEGYREYGIDLSNEPIVGIGTLCRRQNTEEAAQIITRIHHEIPRASLHAFGAKITGLAKFGHMLGGADSMAWSLNARYRPPLPGHTHASCANCLDYALQWRALVLSAIDRPQQTRLAG